MGQLKLTTAANNNEMQTASSEGSVVIVQTSGAVTIAFGEAATANSFDLATGTHTFNGRQFSGANVNIFDAAGGKTIKVLW